MNLKYSKLLCGCLLLWAHSTLSAQDITARVAKYKGDKVCAISYTYDDGLKEHYTLVAPEMEKRGFRGTFWVNGISVNRDTTRVTWAELREMALRGHEISNHGWSHANLTKISKEEIITEIEKNDSIIWKEVGIPSRTFCYPFNAMNQSVVELASAGRIGTRTRQHGMGSRSTPENMEAWVIKLIETQNWGIAMIHGITRGYDAFGKSAPILWDHFDKVKARETEIWIGTFREVAAYTKEYEELKCDIVRKGNKLTITPHLSLDSGLFNQPLTMVVESGDMQKVNVKQGRKKLAAVLLPGKAVFDFDPYGGVVEVKVR